MPDTLSEIRKRHDDPVICQYDQRPQPCDASVALAHIDALTAGSAGPRRLREALDLCGIGFIDGHLASTWADAIAAEYAGLSGEEPTMPDTLRRFAMIGGLTDRHMAPADDGEYVRYADVRAHIDALTAAVEGQDGFGFDGWLTRNTGSRHPQRGAGRVIPSIDYLTLVLSAGSCWPARRASCRARSVTAGVRAGGGGPVPVHRRHGARLPKRVRTMTQSHLFDNDDERIIERITPDAFQYVEDGFDAWCDQYKLPHRPWGAAAEDVDTRAWLREGDSWQRNRADRIVRFGKMTMLLVDIKTTTARNGHTGNLSLKCGRCGRPTWNAQTNHLCHLARRRVVVHDAVRDHDRRDILVLRRLLALRPTPRLCGVAGQMPDPHRAAWVGRSVRRRVDGSRSTIGRTAPRPDAMNDQTLMAFEDVWMPLPTGERVSVTTVVDDTTAETVAPFDYAWTGTTSFQRSGIPPELPEDWGIGVIVGASGSGKSSMLASFGSTVEPDWDDRAIAAQFNGPSDALERFAAVGLNSVPTWTKPYTVLSTGERFRADLARMLGSNVVIDEFTSVVDRTVAMSASHALRRWVDQTGASRLVIATCHRDVLPWLKPDWVIDLDIRSWSLYPRGVFNAQTLWLRYTPQRYLLGTYSLPPLPHRHVESRGQVLRGDHRRCIVRVRVGVAVPERPIGQCIPRTPDGRAARFPRPRSRCAVVRFHRWPLR